MAVKRVSLLFTSLLLSNAAVIPTEYLKDTYQGDVPRDYSRVTSRDVSSTDYDFVIVGAGIAGLVIGSRLSEDLNGIKTIPDVRSKVY
jgi:hypothetical protein